MRRGYNCGVKSRYDFDEKKAYEQSDIQGQAEIMSDKMIGMNMPLDMTIETKEKCEDLRISLVFDKTNAEELNKKQSDFKVFYFEGK